jgi:hypothetical protein
VNRVSQACDRTQGLSHSTEASQAEGTACDRTQEKEDRRNGGTGIERKMECRILRNGREKKTETIEIRKKKQNKETNKWERMID